MSFAKRWAMSDRNRWVSMFGFVSLLALLAWVPTSFTQSSGLAFSPSQPNDAHHVAHRSPGRSTAPLLVATGADANLFANDLSLDTEEQDGTRVEERDQTKALTEPRAAFLIACIFHDFRDRQMVVPPRSTSLYPLRC